MLLPPANLFALPLAADKPPPMLLWLAVAVLAFVTVAVLVVTTSLAVPWLQSFLSGRPITFLQIVGMRLRKVDARQVIRCGIMATQAGCPIPWPQLESAYLQGVDLERVTLAYIQSHREERGYTFEQLVEADTRQRLAEMFERG